ncbi:uncharacterized protein PFL1_03977 [Pseudozyma flocculosa PF-1]|uniref:Transmembrane protein n=2 Tax=Pseudozyma flocculosa TaxID=84751 RepID=A0A5C3EYA3_9BASI|nr:uncharacterized protein PFL1_03977 [Pseudozyma flocculosa PF-1]EPQ28674.1 hypothetical protein PFL1_03977 [Pseudozyma flocculosa PF-1]SPO36626.1 uncharacterized protein PSFLO_02097 [Pseudozyma flocculosa]
MPDWKSPVTLGQAFSAATALMYICIGLMLADTARFASFDWSIITGKRARRWPQIPYIFLKLCYWAYIVTNLYFVLALHEFSCNGVLQAIEMQMGWITVASSVLLACRAVCVYTGRERTVVSAFLFVFTLGLLAAWMVGVPDGVAAWVPNGGNPWQDGTCAFVSISTRYSIKYIVTIVFDLCVMLLTVVGVLRMNGSSHIGSVLIQQGILYFVATFLINALVTGLTLAQLNPVMSLIGAIPASTVCVMCSTRLYVELAREAQHRPGGVTSTQVSSSSTGEKIARLFKRSGGGNSGIGSGTASASAQHNSYTLRSNTAGGFNVKPLRYGGRHHERSASPAGGKSMDAADSAEDLEAQTLRSNKAGGGGGGFVAITESQVVTSEPMPDYLVGNTAFSPTRPAAAQQSPVDARSDGGVVSPIGDHPYSQDIKSHYPRLSRS